MNVLHDPHKLLALVMPYAIRAVAALLIFIIGRWVLRVLIRLMDRMMVRASVDPTLIKFLTHVVFVVGMALVIIAALSRLGVNTTSAAAILGGAAIAIGLSLQGQLPSFAAGVLLVVFRPLRVGEWIDIGGKSGLVIEINMFFTTLTRFGNQMVVIPNSQVWSGTITNFGRNPWRKLDLTIGIGYDSNLLKAKKILEELVCSDERIMKDPPAAVALKALNDSSVDFAVRVCAKNSDWWLCNAHCWNRSNCASMRKVSKYHSRRPRSTSNTCRRRNPPTPQSPWRHPDRRVARRACLRTASGRS